MSTTAEAKVPTITIALTVTYEGKANMTMSDFMNECTKANAMKDAMVKFGGSVSGKVTIGKQEFRL